MTVRIRAPRIRVRRSTRRKGVELANDVDRKVFEEGGTK